MRQRANMRHRAKFGDFSIFQDGGRRHLGFSKCGNFRGGIGQDDENALPSQISSRSVKRLLTYGHFSIFQDGGRFHLGFSKSENFMDKKAQEGQSASPCQISRRSVKPLLRYGDLF